MEIRILGPLEVIDDDRTIALPRGRGRALLAILALHAGTVVSIDRLIGELWGETPPPTAATALHGLVSTLRKRLEPARASGQVPTVLATCAPGYLLAIDRTDVDASRFRRLVEAAGGMAAAERAVQLRAALALWRGPALADFVYEPFAQSAITSLEEMRLTAIEQRIAADLSLDRHTELVAELAELCADHPLRERLRGQLMVALYRCGRQAEALEVYGQARRVLIEELGIEPGAELRYLERAILQQDRALAFPVPAAPPEAGPDPEAAAARSWIRLGRRMVTVVFVDLAAVTGQGQDPDPETLRTIVARGYKAAAGAITRHGGTVEGFIGDVVVAVFGVPTAHEDDAVRAARAAVELRQALIELNAELERDRGTTLTARVGINTGEVVVGDPAAGPSATSGTTVNAASRLQQAAAAGEVLLGESTRRLVENAAIVEPLEPTRVDGDDPLAVAWRLVDLIPGARSRAPLLDTSFVGRAGELSRLLAALDRAVTRRRAELFTVIGEAGVGKSRLAVEFAATVADGARALTGRCPAYGEGITFWPLREIVLEAAGEQGREAVQRLFDGEADARSIADQVSDALGLAEAVGDATRLFPAVRRLLEVLAKARPLVVILEDLHWAQPTLLDLLTYLAGSIRASVMLLGLARPDLLEGQPTWVQAHDDAKSLFLAPLGPDDTAMLVARLGGRMLPPETRTRVIDTAQGNPLFVEQLLAGLRRDREFAIPPTVQALLAARLDQLGPAERDLLRCAAVAGADFSLGALSALIPDEARPFTARHLQILEEKELISPSRRTFLGEPAFTFRHVLIQTAAYRSITRQTRSELHERFAEWLQGRTEHSSESDALIGYHLEQAYRHRLQLGMLDERTRAHRSASGSAHRSHRRRRPLRAQGKRRCRRPGPQTPQLRC